MRIAGRFFRQGRHFKQGVFSRQGFQKILILQAWLTYVVCVEKSPVLHKPVLAHKIDELHIRCSTTANCACCISNFLLCNSNFIHVMKF